MAKEDYLLNKCGKDNPFKVPEGYFDQFANQLMTELPERTFEFEPQKKVTLWDKVKPVVYLAAMFAGIALMFAVAEDFMGTDAESNNQEVALNAGEQSKMTGDNYDDIAADYCNYVMRESEMDDYSMYLYMEEIVE